MKNQWMAYLLTLPLNLMAFSIQGDVSYFRPTASVLRQIYGSAWVDYKLEMQQPLSYDHEFWKRLSIFADGSYLSKEGRSLGGDDKTAIRITAVSLGIKWVQPLSHSTHFYLGGAPRYFFLQIHDHSSEGKKRIYKDGLGSMAIAGLTFDLYKGLCLDLFTSYSFKRWSKPSTPARVEGYSLEAGGLDIGGGLSWRF